MAHTPSAETRAHSTVPCPSRVRIGSADAAAATGPGASPIEKPAMFLAVPGKAAPDISQNTVAHQTDAGGRLAVSV